MFSTRAPDCLFDPMEFSRHSILVGLFSRYVFARRQMRDRVGTGWSNEEVFAAGVLHDMPIAILAWVAPSAYNRVHLLCKGHNIPFDQAFHDIFEGSVRQLGKRAIKTWGLPEFFGLTSEFVDDPWDAPKEKVPIMAINYASAIADSNIAISNGYGSAPWSCPVSIPREVSLEVALPDEERDTAFALLLGQLDQYLPSESEINNLNPGKRNAA